MIVVAVLIMLTGFAVFTWACSRFLSSLWPETSLPVVKVQTFLIPAASVPISLNLYGLQALLQTDASHQVAVDTRWRSADEKWLMELGMQELLGKRLRVAVSQNRQQAVWKPKQSLVLFAVSILLILLGTAQLLVTVHGQTLGEARTFSVFGFGFFLIGIAAVLSYALPTSGWMQTDARVLEATNSRESTYKRAEKSLHLLYVYSVHGKNFVAGDTLHGNERFLQLDQTYGDPHVGNKIAIRVDPNDPLRTAAVKHFNWFFYLWIPFSAFLFLFGIHSIKNEKEISP